MNGPNISRIEFYRPLPPLAYLPMVIIWFGIGEFSKVYLIFLAIFAPMAIAARSAHARSLTNPPRARAERHVAVPRTVSPRRRHGPSVRFGCNAPPVAGAGPRLPSSASSPI